MGSNSATAVDDDEWQLRRIGRMPFLDADRNDLYGYAADIVYHDCDAVSRLLYFSCGYTHIRRVEHLNAVLSRIPTITDNTTTSHTATAPASTIRFWIADAAQICCWYALLHITDESHRSIGCHSDYELSFIASEHLRKPTLEIF